MPRPPLLPHLLAPLLALLPAAEAAADLAVQLDPPVAARCPTPSEITARWRTIAPPGAERMRVQLAIEATADTLRGTLTLTPPDAAAAIRRIDARRDGCAPLVDALLTAAALLAAPPPQFAPEDPPLAADPPPVDPPPITEPAPAPAEPPAAPAPAPAEPPAAPAPAPAEPPAAPAPVPAEPSAARTEPAPAPAEPLAVPAPPAEVPPPPPAKPPAAPAEPLAVPAPPAEVPAPAPAGPAAASTRAPDEPPAAPAPAPVEPAPVAPTPTEPAPTTPATPTPNPAPYTLALALHADAGATPAPLIALELRATTAPDAPFALAAALQLGAMPQAPLTAGAATLERYAALALACWRPTPFDLCLATRAGVLVLHPRALDGADTLTADLALGARAGWRLPLTDHFTLALDAELLAPLRRLRLTVDAAPAFTAWPLAPGAGLALEWRP